MRTFDPDEVDRPRLASLANGLVAPRPVAWVSTLGPGGAPNLAPFSFFNAFSTAPFTIGIGPGSREGLNKDSLRNIKESGEFTVSLVTEELAPVANLSSAEFDPTVDEWETTGLSKRPSVVIGPPSVAESPAALECRVFTIVDLGAAEKPTNSLVIARVLRIHVSEHVIDPETLRVDAEALGLVGRMGGDLWCTTRDRFSLRRPTLEAGHARVPVAPEPDHGIDVRWRRP
jgi:flavin reductase (DIM6/NTAB) family NADH-FMN oxidoreductase RutF